eukprot:jgi/Tetstr1/428648/TSEL_018636.t1
MTVHRIFVSSEQRTSGHRGDFVVDTSKEFARFDSRRVMCAVEFCDVVRYTSEGDGYVANPANSSGLLLEAPDLRAATSYESWSGNSSCALTLLQNYATAGVYGLAHDVPYVRRKHIGVEVDFDFVKRLGSMRFRLRRCASEFGAGDDFSLVSESDDLEAWAFQLVFWEPCKCLLMQPFAYDFFRAWVSSEQGRGSIVDCRIPVMLNTSRSVDTSEGKWMVALEFYTPLLCTKDPADQPHSVVLACPTLVDSDDRHILGHLGKSYRTGEESMYGQRYFIKPGSRDVAGHELRVSIDSLTELHLQLRDAVSLALLDPLEFQPGYVELIDDNANSSITPLGVYTTQDNTPPVITARSVSRGTPPTTVLNVTFNVTDNDAVQTIYVLLNDTQDTNPGPALIKTIGDAFPGGTTSHTYTGLTPDTIYYTWITAKDQAGNETSVDGFGPIATNADSTAPTVDSFSLVAGTDAESQVSISLTISDTA